MGRDGLVVCVFLTSLLSLALAYTAWKGVRR